MKLASTVTVLMFVGMLASACAPQVAPGPSPTATWEVGETQYETVTPSTTPSPTATATRTPAPVPSSTAAPAFSQLQVINFETGSYGAKVLMKLPGVTVPYRVSIGGIEFDCVLATDYPDRLACVGAKLPPADATLDVVFLDRVTDQVVYRTRMGFSSAIYTILSPLPKFRGNATRDPSCPAVDRSSLHCDWECRVSDGSPCVEASCYDWCGYAFSIHTCPDDMPLPAPLCNADQVAEMKALYGIP